MSKTIFEFAAMLDGREYGSEMTRNEERLAEQLGFLVVFGASDDNTEFRGVISDEISAYGGATHHLTEHGVYYRHEDEKWLIENGWQKPPVLLAIRALWCPDSFDGSWLITTDAPHATFDVMEDGKLFCRGIVVDLRNLPGAQ